MNRRLIFIVVLIGLLALAVLTGLAHAQAGGYSLSWWTADGGGGSSSAVNYSLGGSIGQADTGTMNGTGYQLTGGFWISPETEPNTNPQIYLPLVIR